MWLARLFGRRELLNVVVVGLVEGSAGETLTFTHRVDVNQHVLHLATIRNAEVGLVRASKKVATSASDAVTSGRKLSALNATTASFTLSLRRRYSSWFLVRDRQPFGDRGAQLFHHQRATDAVFEIADRERRIL